MKNKDIDLNAILPLLKKYFKRFSKHGVFAALLGVLLVYVFVVWRISQLASAEPTPEEVDTAAAATNIPRVDAKAINQIQSLEQSNTQIHSLFKAARNNPFQE